MPRKTTTTQQTTKSSTTSDDTEVSYDVINAQSWNINEHNCGAAKANKSGQGKSAILTYGKRRFYLKTPKMYCPFGASQPKPKPGDAPKENEQWSVQLAFGDDETCQAFQQKAQEFDEFMIDEGVKPENNVGWLGASKAKPFSRDVVDSKYTKMVKYSKDKTTGEASTQYPPFVRVSFPTTFKAPYEFTCEIYDKNNELLSVSTNPTAPNSITKVIQNGCWCTALISGSIWCTTQGYGVTWRVAQLKIFPPKGSIPKGKCLVDDPEDDDEEVEEEKEEKEPKKAEVKKTEVKKAEVKKEEPKKEEAKKEEVKEEEKIEEEGDEEEEEEMIEEDETAQVITPPPQPIAVVDKAKPKASVTKK